MSKRTHTTLPILILLLVALGAIVVWAGSSVHTNLFWQVLNSGGVPATSGSSHIALNGSLGQTAIGISSSADSATVLRSGYWPGTMGAGWEVLLPIIIRSP